MDNHPELESERQYIRGAYEQVRKLRSSLSSNLQEMYFQEKGGTHQARAERDIVVNTTLERLNHLDFGELALCFGRIDHEVGPMSNGDRFYLGRIAVADDSMEPLVVDWRAPVAEPFYRATALNPMGLKLRRHFQLHGEDLISIEDEPLSGDVDTSNELVGPGALYSAIDKARSGQMGDIVATIQGEQDRIIRSPLAGVLVVQGGPGTGKTAVALHRAAYLLYTHRARLESQRVLVIAPNPTFLKYIERVLPSLGESGVELTTITRMVDVSRQLRTAQEAEAVIKADRRMVRFIEKAVLDRQRPLSSPIEISIGSVTVSITKELSALAVRRGKRRSGTHNERVRLVENFLANELAAEYVKKSEYYASLRIDEKESEEDAKAVSTEIDQDEVDQVAEIAREIRSDPTFLRAVGRIWPRLSPEDLLDDLYSHGALTKLAARDILSSDEVSILNQTYVQGQLSDADLPLLDEALVHLGPFSKRQQLPVKYGHIVVDEAQELSYMQSRMVGRRTLSSSVTLVGDLAQSTAPYAVGDWSKIVEPIAISIKEWRYEQLSINYRTPSEILEVANRLYDPKSMGLMPTRAIRSTGVSPNIINCDSDVTQCAINAVIEMANELKIGLIGVVIPNHSQCDESLIYRSIDLLLNDLPDVKVDVRGFDQSKGLEFDGVIVVNPSRLVASKRTKKAAFFTAVTRATKRLSIIVESDEVRTLNSWGIIL
ncbi:MAG: AAA family ATPase [Actinomycetota bacterium]|nr:AAA family ATPase [Actinomycetota bacterium]